MSCPHLHFNASVDVNRIQKSEQEPETIVAYTADVRIFCRESGQQFEFLGLPNGYSCYRPTVSIDGQTLSAPIAVPGTRPAEGLAGFTVTHQVFEEKEPTKQ